MKRSVKSKIAMLSLALTVGLGSAAWGQPEPAGSGCPDGFHLHAMEGHHDHGGHAHRHVGSSLDLNGDGKICVKHVSADGSVHVHIDNVVPKR